MHSVTIELGNALDYNDDGLLAGAFECRWVEIVVCSRMMEFGAEYPADVSSRGSQPQPR